MASFPVSLTALDMYAVEDGISYQPVSTIVSEIIHDLSPMMQQDGFTFPYTEEEVDTSSEQDSTERFTELQVLSADSNPMWGCASKAEPPQFRPVYSPDGYRSDQDFCIPTNNVFSAQCRGYRPDGYDSDGMTGSGSESPTSSRGSSTSSDEDEDYVPLEISDDEEEAEDEAPSPKWSCRYNPSGFIARAPTSSSKRRHGQPILWKFLYEMLMDPRYGKHIYWTNQSKGMFKFSSEHKEEIAKMWGEKKGNRCVMTYQKMARSLRNYSNQKRHLVKVKRKLQYQFLTDTRLARA
ncbi:transcription factor Spi-B-like isoform X2 [Branchiostoma lanceolatum]